MKPRRINRLVRDSPIKVVPVSPVRGFTNRRLFRQAKQEGIFKKAGNQLVQAVQTLHKREPSQYSHRINIGRNTHYVLDRPRGQRVITSKGAGTVEVSPMKQIVKGEYDKRQLFTHVPQEPIVHRKFWGGMTLAEARMNQEFSNAISKAFDQAKRKREKAYQLAARHGVDHAPTFQIVNVTRPQALEVRFSAPEAKKWFEDHAAKMSPAQRKAILIKIQKGGSNVRLRLPQAQAAKVLGIPSEFANEQVIMNYQTQSALRLRDHNLHRLSTMLREIGFREKNRKYFLKNRGPFTQSQAVEKAIMKFAASVSLGVWIMHKRVNGTFSERQEGFTKPSLSSLSTKDTTLAGEILDYDTCQRNIAATELKELQEFDRKLMYGLIEEYVRNVTNSLILDQVSKGKNEDEQLKELMYRRGKLENEALVLSAQILGSN